MKNIEFTYHNQVCLFNTKEIDQVSALVPGRLFFKFIPRWQKKEKQLCFTTDLTLAHRKFWDLFSSDSESEAPWLNGFQYCQVCNYKLTCLAEGCSRCLLMNHRYWYSQEEYKLNYTQQKLNIKELKEKFSWVVIQAVKDPGDSLDYVDFTLDRAATAAKWQKQKEELNRARAYRKTQCVSCFVAKYCAKNKWVIEHCKKENKYSGKGAVTRNDLIQFIKNHKDNLLHFYLLNYLNDNLNNLVPKKYLRAESKHIINFIGSKNIITELAVLNTSSGLFAKHVPANLDIKPILKQFYSQNIKDLLDPIYACEVAEIPVVNMKYPRVYSGVLVAKILKDRKIEKIYHKNIFYNYNKSYKYKSWLHYP